MSCDTRLNHMIPNITEPRGIAITSNGDADDNDEKVYVTQFDAVDRPGTIIGADDYKEGRVDMPWHIAFEPNSNEGWVVA